MTLLSRLVRNRPKVEPLAVKVYTRRDCCCCHKALDLLKRYRRRHNLSIAVVEIDGDPSLEARHGQSVPVVEVGGKVRFRGVVNPVLLERLLLAEGRGR
jgi:glutaredoxin